MESRSRENKKTEKSGANPSFYEIAAKIATFCDELDKAAKEEKK